MGVPPIETGSSEVMDEIVEVPDMSKYGAGILHAHDEALLHSVGYTDIALLFLTLLADRVVPGGFLSEFVSLESSMRRSTERRIRMAANLTDAEAVRLLAAEKQRKTT